MLMEAELQSQVAFHLTGRRPAAGLDAVDALALRPALFARYRDLAALRYDYPLLLVEDGERVQALSGVFDRLLQGIAQGEHAERVTRHVLLLERQLRRLSPKAPRGRCRLSGIQPPSAWACTATRRCRIASPGRRRP